MLLSHMNIKNNNTPAVNDKNTGSPIKGEPVFLMVGKLRRAHGVGGEILMDINTHFPERLQAGKTIYIGERHQEYKIENIRSANKNLIIKFAEVNTPEEVVQFRNQLVYVSSAGLPRLPEGEYYHHQLLGLRVLTENGEEIGTIDDILETGANDVYVIKQNNRQELLVPAIFDVVIAYSLEEGKIIVRLPEYL
jgi:16S rRNA processing protein RimM